MSERRQTAMIRNPMSDIKERRVTSVFTADLFSSCKTGEVMESAPDSRRRKLRTLFLGLAMIALHKLYFLPWVSHHLEDLAKLRDHDPVVGTRAIAQFVQALLLPYVLFGIAVAMVAVIISLRALRKRRWPFPEAKVERPTEVISGWCLYLRFGLVGVLALTMMLAVWIAYLKTIEFFWDIHLKTITATETRELRQAKNPTVHPVYIQREHDT